MLTGTGGFGVGLPFPLGMASNNAEVEVTNGGRRQAPGTARLYGDVTTDRIRNLSTGNGLEITGHIAATECVEISTASGNERLGFVSIGTGARTPAVDRVNPAEPDFGSLRPGLNAVIFEAGVNVSDRATLSRGGPAGRGVRLTL